MQQRQLLVSDKNKLSIRRQCQLLDISRAGYYYESKGESAYNEELMRLIDAFYMQYPFSGSPKIWDHLVKQGHQINIKRVQRLMKVMGISAIYPKKRTTIPNKEHKKYPYLLNNLEINRPDQVWCTDITYVRLKKGFMYLVAIMDWHSRYVIEWRLSNTLDAQFCIDALESALGTGTPEIFNSDQGAQFTSQGFIQVLKDAGIDISMDGKGRAYDNIFIERLWRTVKYENIYLKAYETVHELVTGLTDYFKFYNHIRAHQSLGNKTPYQVYVNKGVQNDVDP